MGRLRGRDDVLSEFFMGRCEVMRWRAVHVSSTVPAQWDRRAGQGRGMRSARFSAAPHELLEPPGANGVDLGHTRTSCNATDECREQQPPTTLKLTLLRTPAS